MPRSRCSPSYLKHLERTKPLRARTCFQPELRSLASTRFSVTCFEFVTWDNFDVSRSPFIFPIKCVELHDDCQLLISRFVTVQSAWIDAAVHPICPIRGIYRTIHLKTYFTHMLRAWAWEKQQWRCWEKTKTKNPQTPTICHLSQPISLPCKGESGKTHYKRCVKSILRFVWVACVR